MTVTTPARSRVFISDIILTIKNYLCTKYHANIHMHIKVIEFFSFQWRPCWKFKMAATTAARSRVFIYYIILTIKKTINTQNFMLFWQFEQFWCLMSFNRPTMTNIQISLIADTIHVHKDNVIYYTVILRA